MVLTIRTVHGAESRPLSDNTPHKRVVAIDGGGTRCRFAIDDSNTRTVVEGGPANASTDFEATIECIEAGLRALASESGALLEELFDCPAFVGLAGIKSDETIQRMREALPLSKAHYCEDRLAAVRGALGKQDGFIVHCGTGSFIAAQRNNHHRYAGGWGAILGDEASAYWVARRALSLVLQQQDGFLPLSPLASALLVRCGGADGIVMFAGQATPAELSELAPMVTDFATRQDSLAFMVMQEAADYIVHCLDQLNWSSVLPVCLSGGIAPHCKAFLPADIKNAVVEPMGTPLDGAIQLAHELL